MRSENGRGTRRLVGRMAAASVVALGTGLATGASAVVFGPATPEGFVAGLTGASTFNQPDGPGSITCPLCDATVNFTAYHNADGSNWATDIGINPTFIGSADATARWVFFYQVQNTDPSPAQEGSLENFNVTTTSPSGDPVSNFYTSGGFVDDTVLDPFTDPFSQMPSLIDIPNDQTPGEISPKTITALNTSNVAPDQLLFAEPDGLNAIASAAVRAGSTTYGGALFTLDPLVSPLGFTDLLFLTSDADHAGFVWAETESPGGFGAAGDVPGASTRVPVPASLLLLLSGLAGMHLVGRHRRG